MNCSELRDHYELYALGLAEEPERAELRAHLDRGCEVCMAGMKRARELTALLGGSPAPAAATTAPPMNDEEFPPRRSLARNHSARRQDGILTHTVWCNHSTTEGLSRLSAACGICAAASVVSFSENFLIRKRDVVSSNRCPTPAIMPPTCTSPS